MMVIGMIGTPDLMQDEHALLERLILPSLLLVPSGKSLRIFPPGFFEPQYQDFQGLIVLLPVNSIYPAFLIAVPEKGDLEKFLFGDPSKLPRNKAENDQNIKIALMISHKDLWFCSQDIFLTNDFDPCVGKDEQDFRPEPGEAMDLFLLW